MKFNRRYFRGCTYFFVVVLVAGLSSCTGVRHLEDDEKLYTSGKVSISDAENVENRRNLQTELEGVMRPEPNRTFFWVFRPRISFYNLFGETEEETFRWRTQRRFGEPAVVYDPEQTERNLQLLNNRMFNKGYFHATTAYTVKERNRRVKVRYTIQAGKPYRIEEVVYPANSHAIARELTTLRAGSLLKEGDIYELQKLKDERMRLERALRNRGYFYFQDNHLRFDTDTTVGDHGVALRLRMKPDSPPEAYVPYRINRIYLHVENPFERRDKGQPDTLAFATENSDTIYIIYRDYSFRPDILFNALTLEPGQLYSRNEHERSISRLMSIGSFRFANIRYQPAPDLDSTLNANIYVTPAELRSIELELKTVTKSTNYAGPEISGMFRNRNWFNGGEQLTWNLRTGFEMRTTGEWAGISSYEAGTDVSVSIPRLIAPGFMQQRRSSYLPRTRVSLGAQLLNRTELYRMDAFKLQAGYSWSPTSRQEHMFHPVSLNFVRLTQPSEEFEQRLEENPYLRRSFEEQFIPGSNYSFTFNTQVDEGRSNDFYLYMGTDISGNLLGGIQTLTEGRSPTPDNPHKLGGLSYSQYLRFDADFRFFQQVTSQSRLAMRLIGGYGIPYGNSSTLPFIKQFFVGGTNSIRAWHPRTLGPGSEPSTIDDDRFADRTGDIQIEGNIEYRFPLFGWFRGAVFTDAGNVWMTQYDPDRTGAQFKSNRFISEIAVGSGVGVRMDAQFFVLRLDVAVPMRDPVHGWVTDEINLSNREWRRNNVVYSLAIGYSI